MTSLRWKREQRRDELLAAAERTPGQDVLPPPRGGVRRVGPSRDGMPSVRIMAEKNRLTAGQIPPSTISAGYQGKGIPEACGFVEGGRIGGIAAQEVQHPAARRRVGKDSGNHCGNAVVVARQQQRQAVAIPQMGRELLCEIPH